jgi:Domain of Unknown Function (DUF928)
MKYSFLSRSRLSVISITAGILIPLSFAVAQPIALALKFTPPPIPPDRSAPGNRGEGASRGCTTGEHPLTALVPSYRQTDGLTQVWGMTSQAQPSFWFYLPYEPATIQTLEFVVQDDQDETLYRNEIPDPSRSGMMQVKLPAGVPLAVGKAYHWFFKVTAVCGANQPETLTYVEGWVQRQALTAAVSDRLQQATPQQQEAIYAENGLWYDALNALAERRFANPTDAALARDWKELLGAIGLGDLAE